MADGFRVARWSLEEYREYLHVLARRSVSPRLQTKFEASDLVQNTLLDAHAHLDQFRGRNEPELKAWLRRILANNLANSIKALHTGKRNQGLEQSLFATMDDTSARLERGLISVEPTPSSILIRHERALQVARALNLLPEDQRTALELRYFQDRSLDEICRLMGRSEASVAGLLRRGLKALRATLSDAPT